MFHLVIRELLQVIAQTAEIRDASLFTQLQDASQRILLAGRREFANSGNFIHFYPWSAFYLKSDDVIRTYLYKKYGLIFYI